MGENFLVSLIQIATQIGTPLALAGVGLSLFFGVFYYFISKANVGGISARGLTKLLTRLFSYGFALSLTALVLGVLSWITTYFIGPMVTQNKLEGYLLRKDYNSVISEASVYVVNYPKDDLVRHMLGTSYYALGKFEEGKKLYEDMAELYPNLEVCHPKKAAALSSLSAFYIGLNDPRNGLKYSNQLLNCPNITDMYVINHMTLLSMNITDANQDITLGIPVKYTLKYSYYQSKYYLLKYITHLKVVKTTNTEIEKYLFEALCEDEQVKSIITARFNSGDFSGSPNIVDDFRYEISIMKSLLSKQDKIRILSGFATANCST